jgi:predicted transcriptional regulator
MTIHELRADWKRRRKALGIKQRSFAEECGISFATYAQIEVGANTSPLWTTVMKIQDTLARLEGARPGKRSKLSPPGSSRSSLPSVPKSPAARRKRAA